MRGVLLFGAMKWIMAIDIIYLGVLAWMLLFDKNLWTLPPEKPMTDQEFKDAYNQMKREMNEESTRKWRRDGEVERRGYDR